LYEQGRIHHVGVLATLEDQLTSWTPDQPKSPDRLDALVWAFTELIQHSGAAAYLSALARFCPAGHPNRQSDVVCVTCGQTLADVT
jgi:hypothetical protein